MALPWLRITWVEIIQVGIVKMGIVLLRYAEFEESKWIHGESGFF